MNKIFGITLMVLAIALAVVPAFTDCQSQGKSITTSTGKTVPMKCHWTGIAELGMAIPILGVGAMMTFNRNRGNLRNLGVLGVVLGAVAIALPTGLIGVCATPTMMCHTLMKPALITMGALVITGSVGMVILAQRFKE